MVIVVVWCVEDYQVICLVGLFIVWVICLVYEVQLDVVLLGKILYLCMLGLLVMDMDFIVIQIECIDEIVKLVGMGEMVVEVIEWVMCGEFDFIVSLCSCVVMLKGVDVNIL